MNILDAFENHGIAIRRKNDKEWEAACPSCGGKDRCSLWPQHTTGTGGRYWCRQCRKGGDAIHFLQEFEGLNFREACQKAGKASLAGGERRNNHGQGANKAHSFPARQKSYLPVEQWSKQGGAFLYDCQSDKALGSEEAIMRITCERYLSEGSYLRQIGIGWNDRDRYPYRKDWGLDGDRKLVLPRGIVIATTYKDRIVALTIRCMDKKRPKYQQVVGGAVDVPFIPKIQYGKPIFLVESGLDAALLDCYADDLCVAVALGGTCKRVDADTMAFIQAAPLIIASPDNDEAGSKAWTHWQKLFPSARLYRATKAKDIGDMHKLSCSQFLQNTWDIPPVRIWTQFALEYAKTPINAHISNENEKYG